MASRRKKNESNKSDWMKIPDNHIRHIWKKADSDDCEEGPSVVAVSPAWYEENGTPICCCGEDMVYDCTEIVAPERGGQKNG